MPTISPEIFNNEDDSIRESGFDEATPEPAPVHAYFTMEQAWAHPMAEEHPASVPMQALQEVHEEHWYNMFLFEQQRPAESQIDGECPSEEAVATMAASNTNFVTEQRAIYEALRAQANARQEVVAPEVQLQATVLKNNTSCTSYAPPTNYRTGQFDDDSVSATISIVGFTSTHYTQGTDSFEDE
ncbi:Hydroxymethylglutaryl-CoA lyase, mitochondrial [Hordeum vulgare]|nr:Hydroxymethylglutaryl-CoA lyase, mitochondrial [Hordeum vulgare]